MILILLTIIEDVPKDIPKWTDIASAVSAIIGIPLVLFTLYKLVKKDKERESEINSLSTIADKLTGMQVETERRYKATKKPQIGIELQTAQVGNRIQIHFTNSNINSSITEYKIKNPGINFLNINHTKSTINDSGGEQLFTVTLNGKDKQIENLFLQIDYTTEEGYTFIQDIIIWRENGKYKLSPGVIINKENSAV